MDGHESQYRKDKAACAKTRRGDDRWELKEWRGGCCAAVRARSARERAGMNSTKKTTNCFLLEAKSGAGRS